MHLYLFRHGDRLQNSADPNLSPTGEIQAQTLKTWVETQKLPTPSELWASPKIRAQQSFSPLAQSLGLRLQIFKELDERTRTESPSLFRARIQDLLNKASRSEGTLFLCSHMDWLEEVLSIIPVADSLTMDGNPLWNPGSFIGLETSNDDVWKILRKGQLQSW